MANRTDPLVKNIRDANPMNLVEKIVRLKVYQHTFWMEQCSGLTAEKLVDKAMELNYVGGTFGGNREPTPFLCLIVKMLRIRPDKDIVLEFIKNDRYKYVRLLGAFYLRLTGTDVDVYRYLEPLYNDYRKVRQKLPDGRYYLTHVDEVIEELLTKEYSWDIAMPHLTKRWALEQNGLLEPWKSVLEDDFEEEIEGIVDGSEDDFGFCLPLLFEDHNRKSPERERDRDYRRDSHRHRDRDYDMNRDGDRDRDKDRERGINVNEAVTGCTLAIMENRTDPLAKNISGTNLQNLVEEIVRTKIYQHTFWKEQCFGLTAETLVDKAMELNHVGGTFGGNREPTPFLCLILKMLQIQPEKDIIIELIKNDYYKYVRILGAFYLRLTGTDVDVYRYLEPLYNDYRKVRQKLPDGRYYLTHVDEVIEELLTKEYSWDIAMPHLTKRWALEQNGLLEPWKSVLEDDFEEEEQKEEIEEIANGFEQICLEEGK